MAYIVTSEEIKSVSKFSNIRQIDTGNLKGMTRGGLIMGYYSIYIYIYILKILLYDFNKWINFSIFIILFSSKDLKNQQT